MVSNDYLNRFPVNGLGVGQILSPHIISAYGAVVYSLDSQKKWWVRIPVISVLIQATTLQHCRFCSRAPILVHPSIKIR